jgi:hypothetical protein
MRGMNNLHISYKEKTISVSHERDEKHSYLMLGKDNFCIS